MKMLTFLKDLGRNINNCRKFSNDHFCYFSNIIGKENVKISDVVLDAHGHDESYHLVRKPDIVLFPKSTEQVSKIAEYCFGNGLIMIPYGTGTGLEGGVVAEKGGVSIDLSSMEGIVEFNPNDFDISVRPGVTRSQLNEYIKSQGLWFPVDPGADASLCGMAATSASGTNAVKYGTMRQNVLNLEVVLSDGKIINTSGKNNRAKKTSAGYNLTGLFVGSEGTLGFITQATLKLFPIPESMIAAVCSFETIEDCVTATVETLQSGIPVAKIELMDSLAIHACNLYNKLNHPVKPSLFVEFHGSKDNVQEQRVAFESIAQSNNGTGFKYAEEQEARTELWKARHSMLYAAQNLKPGSKSMSTDVCVPISSLPIVISLTQKLMSELKIKAPILGHVGDGNFHCFVNIDPNIQNDYNVAKEFSHRLGSVAIKYGGTCTGEHGIGQGKKSLLHEQMGSDTINIMKLVKQAIDPKSLMNPGKIF